MDLEHKISRCRTTVSANDGRAKAISRNRLGFRELQNPLRWNCISKVWKRRT